MSNEEEVAKSTVGTRLNGLSPFGKGSQRATPPSTSRLVTRVIGVDPGSVCTGYGIIESDGHIIGHVAHGHIKTTSGKSFPERLGEIYQALEIVVSEWMPDAASIEAVFMGNNPSSALKLGQARGAAIAALASHDLPVTEHAPKLVKQTVSGNGKAGKSELQKVTCALLGIETGVQVDAGDALAVAICGARYLLMPEAARQMRKKSVRSRRSGRGLRM